LSKVRNVCQESLPLNYTWQQSEFWNFQYVMVITQIVDRALNL
jgi:hypothetical protein